MLNWRTVTGERNSAFLVKGTLLATALYGRNSRFLIEEVRAYPDGEIDRAYRVRDAHCVTDSEMREGKSSPVVGRFASEVDAVNACNRWLQEDDARRLANRA
jgi:hypothetical protein